LRLRNRIVKATFWTDPTLCRWPRDKREFYRSLWACAEDSCCIEDDMYGVKLAAWPSPSDADMTEEKFIAWRDEMIAVLKLVPYDHESGHALYIPAMARHERPRNPQAPDLPLPPWVEWVRNESDSRKGTYIHTYTVVQPLYNPPSTVPVLPCPVLPPTVPPRSTEGVSDSGKFVAHVESKTGTVSLTWGDKTRRAAMSLVEAYGLDEALSRFNEAKRTAKAGDDSVSLLIARAGTATRSRKSKSGPKCPVCKDTYEQPDGEPCLRCPGGREHHGAAA